MLIVLEGMDNTGKTILAEKIMNRWNDFKYEKPVPSAGPEGQTEEYMLKDTQRVFDRVKNGENIVTDRLNIISEEIYGPICRTESRINESNHVEYMCKLFELNPVIIFCRPSDETILKMGDQFQMDGVREKASHLIKAYDDFFGVLKEVWDYYRYDYESDPEAFLIRAYIQAEKDDRNE